MPNRHESYCARTPTHLGACSNVPMPERDGAPLTLSEARAQLADAQTHLDAEMERYEASNGPRSRALLEAEDAFAEARRRFAYARAGWVL